MRRFRFSIIVLATLVGLCFQVFSQFAQYSQRSLLEKKIYYVANGKVASANYWSLPIGSFPVTLNRRFPGEGNIDVEAEVNFSALSSGYIEGSGYGARGKIGSEAQFAIMDADTVKDLDFNDIDYVYASGDMVKPKKGDTQPLILSCEVNKLTIKNMKIMIWRYDKKFSELKHSKDIDRITAFSFTKDGAYRAVKAQRSVGN